ncbi:MAG: hypothetical protein P8Z34_15940 [Anaerolineales bacterium]
MNKNFLLFRIGSLLIVGQIACRPVMAIGWQEVAIIFMLALILLGPMLWRLYRFIANLHDDHDDDSK